MKPHQTSLHRTQHDDTSNLQNIRTVLKTVLPIFKKYKTRLLVGFTALLCVDSLQLIVPRILKYAIDTLETGAASTKTLFWISGLVLLTGAGAAVFRFCWRYLIIGFSRILEHNLRQQLYDHILSLDRSFFDKNTTGDIMAHASNDLNAIQMACGMGLVAAVDALVVSLATLGFMIHINFKLTLLALLPMPLLVYSTKKLSRQLHHRFDTAQSQFSLLTEFARNAIVSIRLVKAYTMEQQQVTQFRKLGASYMQTNLKVAVIQGLLLPAANLVGNAGLLIILFYGGYLTIIQSISIGDFAAFVTYLQMLIWPLMAVGWVTNITQRGLTSLRRIHLLLNAVSKLPPPHKNLQTETRKTADTILCTTVTQPTVFSFRNLDFFYPGSKKPSLSNISFDTDKKIIGISGRTGSGKSTLCKVLTRMYAIDDKKMFLNGYDVNTLDIFSVRSHIAYVSQEPILFSNTLAANIRIGNQHATEKEIIHAATAASFHEDILLFPKQYETLIGEKGITLSGGQRQRLAIARALISNRPLLLLDDVFSTVDVETEQKIISGILNYLKETTVIFVSNRQKLLALTNEVLFLENGLLVDKGSHETLIKRCNLYRSMVKRLFYQQTPAEKQEPDA